MARVRVDVVGAQAGLHELGGRVALVDRVLPRGEQGHAGRALLGQGALGLARHLLEGALPAHRGEAALLVEAAVAHAQQGPGEAVAAVHDLGVEVALDAVQAAVDRRFRVALDGHHAPVLGGHEDAAAHAAEPAHGLVPLPALPLAHGVQVLALRLAAEADARGSGRGGGDGCLEEIPAVHGGHGCPCAGRWIGSLWPGVQPPLNGCRRP